MSARIRITSDGTPAGTRVFADGKPLNVVSIRLEASVDQPLMTAHLVAYVDDLEIDLLGEQVKVTPP